MTPKPKTANQWVAFNLKRARERAGLTQEQAAEKLEKHLGVRWSKSTFSAAESSANPKARPREFTADEIMAFAAAFALFPSYFLLPDDPPDERLVALVKEQAQYTLARIASTDLTAKSLREAADALDQLAADIGIDFEAALPDNVRNAI